MVKFGVITGSLGNIGDRYCLKGYKSEMPLEEKLKRFSKIQYLEGCEISQDEISGMDEKHVKSEFEKYELSISAVGIDLTSDPIWQFGSISNKDAAIRQKAVDKIKRTMDFSAGIGTGLINVWLGQEGFDYPFQADYAKQWAYSVDAFEQCALHNPKIRLALEPKPREPRNRSLIDSTATGLLMAMDVNKENVGVTIDVGHVLQDGRNMAQSIAYSHAHGKLFNLHINDNHSAWDDDMIVGAVHSVEFIEMFYVLRKIGYDKWCTVDIFPYREDSMRAAEESLLYMQKFNSLVDTIGIDKLDECLRSDDVSDSIRLIRESIFR